MQASTKLGAEAARVFGVSNGLPLRLGTLLRELQSYEQPVTSLDNFRVSISNIRRESVKSIRNLPQVTWEQIRFKFPLVVISFSFLIFGVYQFKISPWTSYSLEARKIIQASENASTNGTNDLTVQQLTSDQKRTVMWNFGIAMFRKTMWGGVAIGLGSIMAWMVKQIVFEIRKFKRVYQNTVTLLEYLQDFEDLINSHTTNQSNWNEFKVGISQIQQRISLLTPY
mmetsp:Transcript_4497/g.6285  ORF Transcript_4497/g.6285 Transcript_4497/m.6285 type:complete len:226 (-) Transcript_4497:28-705(-)|eukprot:CAMPEP_0168557498 /NCGR_PEP_ID=MMETSP0413-20121227/9459_1 /TAXON_ID=136452 /ORGANISM="Filamoeba nolandi, Strain NC-AS-23-1" /LENGTH=225 /DNA_ID=CAMNT_0008588537 /DNA_START=198 /DNA_END=875 /DNA_ORIENTATION=+